MPDRGRRRRDRGCGALSPPRAASILVLGTAADGASLLAAVLREAEGAGPVAVVDVDADGAAALTVPPGAVVLAPAAWLARTGGLRDGSWITVDVAELLADPGGGVRRLCECTGLRYDQALLTPLEDEARRLRIADGHDESAAFTSSFTPSLPAALRALGGSLLVSTYQSGKLVCLRAIGDGLNTHFRHADKPMGIAVAPGRIALGTRTEVWDLRDVPAAAPTIAPAGTHDACFLPRNRHVTGDIAVHEMGFAGGELWVVATAFSCLATLDADHSFVPRWTPPWITEVAAGDRCHLNGMCVVDDRVRYVTALGRTDVPRGWHAGKATGGVLYDVVGEEVVAAGLSMPHSPRVADGRLWVLQSGLGALGVVDPADGKVEVVCELPGFTRGMAIVDGIAFVGLSQIRESSTFGDLPVVRRLSERQSGVWMVDLVRGEIAGFLRFEDLVQEVFDVALLPGSRFPEIADPASPAVAHTFHLP